jgi:glucosyl-dolichyl phosphate glucuronosyltransferase
VSDSEWEKARNPTTYMNISVILCTFNRCRLLPAALDSIAASNMPAGVTWEVLVVDNNSTDQTRDVVEAFSRQHPRRFRYLFEPRAGKSYALNAGIAAAKGDILAFVDDDVTVATEWLRNLTAPFRDGGFAGTGGRVVPHWTTPIPDWLSDDGWMLAGPLVSFDRGPEGCVLDESPVGTNMAFLRRVFDQYGVFRLDLGPSPHNEIRNEDSEFARRLLGAGERIFYVPSAVVHHPVTEDRLNRRYFLAWWFDKGRSEIREQGVPRNTPLFRGVPIYLFRRLARWVALWVMGLNPSHRFECKMKAWHTAGVIAECRSAFRVSRVPSQAAMGSRIT